MTDEVEGQTEAAAPPRRTVQLLFVGAILAGSFLLFLVQPMIARMALPKLGGAPAVWNSAMLVYQALLLAGYAWAHWLGRVRPRTQAAAHLALLVFAALWLPIGLIAMDLPANAEPVLWVPWLLGASIGPLFLAIAAQAPLLQRWYSLATGGRDPYALYAASNIGSFGGLIAYPLLVEPIMTLHAQSWLWTIGYGLVLLAVAGCALMLPRVTADVPHVRHTSPAPGWPRVLHWVALALVPSGLMLATTTFLTTDIVAVPMLWVLPLGLYLLSFPVAFSNSPWVPLLIPKFGPVVLLLFGATLIAGDQEYAWVNAAIGLAVLFMVAVSLHARMYELRPAPDRLTGFYLAMSVGGVLGGVFAALVAPVVFDWTYEYPLLIVAAGLLVPQTFIAPFLEKIWSGTPRWRRIKTLLAVLIIVLWVSLGIRNPLDLLGEMHSQIAFMIIALVGIAAIGRRIVYVTALAGAIILFGGWRSLEMSLADQRTRSYFGVYTVGSGDLERVLTHGTTLHGIQLQGPLALEPTTYYVRESGVGRAMLAAPDLYGPGARIGVVGLGTGTLACYAQPGQQWRFYEIDPTVVSIARDSGKFTFLRRCVPDSQIVIGDARLSLANDSAGSLDLLALDAFSSDAVPMHLLTAEAFQTYRRVLAPNGLLLVHISNRFLRLGPVVASAALRGGWHAAWIDYYPESELIASPTPDGKTQVTQGQPTSVAGSASEWIALSPDKATLDRLVARGGEWRPLHPRPGFVGWTDDYSSIVPVLRQTGLPFLGD